VYFYIKASKIKIIYFKIAKDLIEKVIKDDGQFRDVYASCIKALINEIPITFGPAIKPIFEIAISGIETKRN